MKTTNEPTLEQIKKSLDIITIAEMYGELVRSGNKNNFVYKKNKSISFNENKQIFKEWNGSMEKAGSVLDLVMLMENKNLKDGIARLKELSALDTYTVDPSLQMQRSKKIKEKKKVNFNELQIWGKQELDLVGQHRPVEYINKYTRTIHFDVTSDFQKLFETKKLPPESSKKLDYIFSNLLGWNKLFKCPSIILRDDNGRIVDLIAYRPNKPESYSSWRGGKYFYKNSHDRGNDFLYPFKKEIELIINREEYLIVGEGIKNGLNALLYSVPFISLESTSNTIDSRLLDYIKKYAQKKFKIICMFDGDLAGARAFLNFLKSFNTNLVVIIDNFLKDKENILLKDKSNAEEVLSNFINFINSSNFPLDNFLAFDSNIDFVEYLQGDDFE